jgi:hypothetical protein
MNALFRKGPAVLRHLTSRRRAGPTCVLQTIVEGQILKKISVALHLVLVSPIIKARETRRRPFTAKSSREAGLAKNCTPPISVYPGSNETRILSLTAQIPPHSTKLTGYQLWSWCSCSLPTATARNARHPKGQAA